MTYDRSFALQAEHSQNNLDPPPYFRHRRSIQKLLRTWVPWLLGIVIVVGGLWRLVGFRWWFMPLFAAAVYFMYRDYYRWSRNHDTCDPDNGVLYIEDHSHPFVLFFINGSSDDPIPLDDVELDTPTRSFFDRWVFHCSTLVAGERKLKDVKYVDDLLAIQKYRESLKKQSVSLDRQQLDVQMAILKTLESMGEDLHVLVDLLSSQRDTTQRESDPPTRPIPIQQPAPIENEEEPPNDK
jgi:hypothetical protein